MRSRFAEAMLSASEYRTENRPAATPPLVARRNNLAQTRQLIEARQEEIELELRVLEGDLRNMPEIRLLQAEQKNLEDNWNATCQEWDRIWAKGLA